MMARADLADVEIVGDYAEVADEYYDARRHPTCASFGELSRQYLAPRLAGLGHERLLVEIGAGRSILGPTWQRLRGKLTSLVLIDSSKEMLSYSAEWEKYGAELRNAEASATGLEANCVDIVVSSLGDPYNLPDFWREIARVLRPGGICHFTTPAYEWASAFRPSELITTAQFVRSNGQSVLVPSWVFPRHQQVELFTAAGLKLVETEALTRGDLSSSPAPKLLCVPSDAPIVQGYTVCR